MPWNTAFAKYKSNGPGTNGGLAGLDCGFGLKQIRNQTDNRLYATFTTPSTGMEVGTCCAMIRVTAGTTIVAAKLLWAGTTSAGGLGTSAILAVGDPFGCGRFLGPVLVQSYLGASDGVSCGAFNGTCAVMTKFGPAGSGGRGDACGIGYTYTCDTDIFVTNIANAAMATVGGWTGSVATGGQASATATGVIGLILEVVNP